MTAQDRPLKGAWGMTALIFLFMLINFADKVVVGLAAQPIMAELHLTPEQFGLIGSSFFFLFALSAVIVGFITNRVQTRHTLLVMAIVWSLVQFPMLGTVSLELLIACRIVLGAGEGPAAPVATHAIYKWFPDSLRGLPTAIIAQGSALGVIIAVPALNWIIVNYSWHWAFGALGVVGLLWAVLWLIFGREGTLVDPPVRHAAGGGERVPYRYLLTCPSIVAACCAGFASYWGLALGLTWFTSYLVGGLGYSQKLGGNLSILPWILGMFVVLGGGFISQRLKKAGVSSRLSRGAFASATVILGGCHPALRRQHADARAQACPGGRGRRDRQHHLCRDPDDRERAHAAAAARRHARHHDLGGDPGRRARPARHGRDGAERRHADAGLRARLCRAGFPADRGRPHRPAVHSSGARPQAAGGARRRPAAASAACARVTKTDLIKRT